MATKDYNSLMSERKSTEWDLGKGHRKAQKHITFRFPPPPRKLVSLVLLESCRSQVSPDSGNRNFKKSNAKFLRHFSQMMLATKLSCSCCCEYSDAAVQI